MIRPPRNNRLLFALYFNAALLAALLLVLLSRGQGPGPMPSLISTAYGVPPPQTPPIAGGANLYLMPAQFSVNTWGCYIMDIDAQTLCAYQFYPGDKLLRLVSARNFHFDRKLQNFNTAPNPLEVETLSNHEHEALRAAQDHPAPQSPESNDNK